MVLLPESLASHRLSHGHEKVPTGRPFACNLQAHENKQPKCRKAPSARKGRPTRPVRCKHTVFRQACNLIPEHLIPELAREYKIDARKFSAGSHVLSLVFTHLGRTDSLNETCDALRVHEAEFLRTRGATPPARNTFSNANRTRDPAMAEALYWRTLKHLQVQSR